MPQTPEAQALSAELLNFELVDLEDALREGPGKGQDPLIVCSEKADYDKIIQFTEERRRNPENFPAYSWNPLNPNTCATFARKAVKAGLP